MHTHNTNSLAATSQLLKLKGIIYEPARLKDDLLGHPDYPSLFAVHHVLNQYGLPNSPVEVNAESLDHLGQPFLAYMQLPGVGNDFAAVTNLHNGSITYTNTKGKAETISRQDFLSKWKNVAVMVSNISGEASAVSSAAASAPDRVPEKRTIGEINTKVLGAITVFLLIVLATLNGATPFIFAPWLLLKMGGLAVTVLLLMYEADRQNETVKQFCSAGKTINCDAVLQSKGAKIGPFSWSEMGFAYFAGTFLYLLLAANSPTNWPPLALLSLLVLPYTIYSIYYQYKVVKQWCKLCLVIQGLILVEALFVMLTVVLPANWQLFGWQPALLLLPFLALPLIIWLALKPALQKAATADGFKYAYMRLQNDPQVFEAMLRRQAAAPAGYKELGILLGSEFAKNTIIKVCNPFCNPCAAMHTILEELLTKIDVKLYIIFTGTNSDIIGRVSRHFIALNYQNGDLVKEALHWWYNNPARNEVELRKIYPVVNADGDVIKKHLDYTDAWTKEAEIRFTPTIFINGYKLPEMYKTTDLLRSFRNE